MANDESRSGDLATPTVGSATLSIVGSITITWASIEWMLEGCIWGLTSGDSEALVYVTENMPARRKLELMEKCAKAVQLPDEDRARLLKLIRDTDAVRIERNRFAHDIWFELRNSAHVGPPSLYSIPRRRPKDGELFGRTHTFMDVTALALNVISLMNRWSEEYAWLKKRLRSSP